MTTNTPQPQASLGRLHEFLLTISVLLSKDKIYLTLKKTIENGDFLVSSAS